VPREKDMEREKERARTLLFLYQIPLTAFPLFQSFPLTESPHQARERVKCLSGERVIS